MTDEAGRQLTIPASIKKVYCTSPMGTNLMYMLAPDMLVGWNISPTALEKEYIPEKYRGVTGLGGWFGKNTTGNVEEIIKRAPGRGALHRLSGRSGHLRRRSHTGTTPHTRDHDRREPGQEAGTRSRYVGKLLGVEARANELADLLRTASSRKPRPILPN